MDAEHAQQAAGTRVIVFTLDRPFAPNQEWNVDVFDGQFATIQSTKSFVRDDPSPTGGLVLILDPNIAAEFELFSVSGGVQICINSTGVSCLASPTNPTNQIRLEPISNAANLTWIFEIIS
ncbi:hypothetical protein QCA50_004750 [Cerrena zonata]|uniref:Uncharacterized protein n=1 Tax=Cerrena zonata TaxID=2478898 RepID=A0AAW0GJM7_9APHY